MRIAISASRKGIDKYQKEQFKLIIKKLLEKTGKLTILHGCTIGGEFTLHNILLDFKERGEDIYIIGCPAFPANNPTSYQSIADCKKLNHIDKLRTYNVRNDTLSLISDILFAFPGDRIRLGNVWDTINRFNGKGKKVIMFEREHFNKKDKDGKAKK